MNHTNASALAMLLVIAAVLAELNLFRIALKALLGRAAVPTRDNARHSSRKTRNTPLLISAAAFLTIGAHSSAAPQDASPITQPTPVTISTDRPSFSDGTGIQPVGSLNLETGYTFTLRHRDGTELQRHNGPELLARVGVIEDQLELRLISAGFAWTRSDSGSGFASDSGWNDVSLGFKLKLADQSGWLPRLALGVQSTLGVGSDAISNQIAEPTLKALWSYDLAQLISERWKGFSLGGNANVAWPTTSGSRFTQGQASIYLTAPCNDRLSVFAEYFVLGPNSKGTDAAHSVDAGLTLLVTRRVQFDARVGVGLNQEADNLFAGFGLSVMF